MGFLGSNIYMIKSFFSEEGNEQSAKFYLFRNILGALVALAVFVIIKAGVIVTTTPAAPGSSVDLNPFLVALFALISGLISEQVADRIRTYGEQWFRSNLAEARYARGLSDALTYDGKKADDLANFFGGDKNLVQSWLSETKPVPTHAQQIIAAWINKPVRDLFSDIPKQPSPAAPAKDKL